MKKLLNTLYVTTPESYLSKDGENIVVSLKQKEAFRIPAINIQSIVTFGYMGVSPGLMDLCSRFGISLTFLSPSGRFLSRLQYQTRGNVLLRKQQYQISDDNQKSLHLARLFIAAKIHNYRIILNRYLRDYGPNQAVELASMQLKSYKRKALLASDKAELLGHEGIASNCYFSVFNNLILQQKSFFKFEGRNRRPPKDAVNALLSFAYTLIANDITAALESVGLDPYVGFLHSIRPGRASFSLDLMEEFRAYLGDRFILSLINKRQISQKDFICQGENSIILSDNGRRIFISAWQTRKKEIITHPYLNEKIEIGLLPQIQASMLAKFLRSDIDDYPVFLIQ